MSITIKRKSDLIRISVADNGASFTEEEINELGKLRERGMNKGGVGLYNVNQRLISLLSENSKLYFEKLK